MEFTAERAATQMLDASCETPLGICARHLRRDARGRGIRRPARRLGMGARRRSRRSGAARRTGRLRWRSACSGRAPATSWSGRRGGAVSARAGVVYLVGAGPGDPGLMTARSLELIASADAILYDRLIPSGALDGAREDAELVYVGKAPGDVAMPQERIDAELVERAQRGLSVVRLKGGDPFVFGRGGEEAEACRAAGVEFEVVPGVTSGVAAPAYAGIPGDPSRRRVGRRVRHWPRGPRQAGDGARLGGARTLPRDARPLHGGQEPARDRPPPDRGGARPGRAGRCDRAGNASRSAGCGCDTRDAGG